MSKPSVIQQSISQQLIKHDKEKRKALNELYKAVDAYCQASKEADTPIPEGYWNRVLIAWGRARAVMGDDTG